jgi:hypothetical protein
MFRYERRHQKLASPAVFLGRVLYSMIVGMMFIGASLAAGVYGYMYFAGLSPVDAFLNASMILGGMGPVDTLNGNPAKVFAGLYALYSGLLLIAVTGIILAPVLHRVLHAIHADEKD